MSCVRGSSRDVYEVRHGNSLSWIFQDDYTRLCSFTNICDILEIDPDYVRTGLVRWRTAQRAGAKHVAT